MNFSRGLVIGFPAAVVQLLLVGCAASAPDAAAERATPRVARSMHASTSPNTSEREVAIGELRTLARGGELDAVTNLTVVGGADDRALSALAALPALQVVRLRDYRHIDAETVVMLLLLPALRELDLGALPGLARRGEVISLTSGTQVLLARLAGADLLPAARPHLLLRSDDGTSLPILAELARPFAVALELPGGLVPRHQPPRLAGSSFDPVAQRRDEARTLVQATEMLARCCELVR